MGLFKRRPRFQSVPGTAIRRLGRVLLYPKKGKLLFATDFHGQLEDFLRVVDVFLTRRRSGEDLYLLFAGDFVHGPAYSEEDFPDFLGDFHVDDTPEIIRELSRLLQSEPRVQSLLGNHEHAHIGGVRTTKFHRSPDEVEFLESRLGAEATHHMKTMFRGFALAALTSCGVMFTHGAPAVREAGLMEVAACSLDGFETSTVSEIYEVPVLGQLLWSKGADQATAASFMQRMSYGTARPRVAVYGHDIVREGVAQEGNQVVLSTSFGLTRLKKTLLEIDLAGTYSTALDMRPGKELYPLFD